MAGMFEGRTALITGGCHGIGRACSQAFRKEGAEVFVIDLSPDADFTGDIGKKKIWKPLRTWSSGRGEEPIFWSTMPRPS